MTNCIFRNSISIQNCILKSTGRIPMRAKATIFFIFLCLRLAAQTTNIKIETSEFIFGDERPFPQCHASTIEKLGNGEYILAWFAGSHEKNDDVAIWIAKGRPGAWTAPKQLAKVRNDPHWNPVFFSAPDGRLLLYFKVGKEIDDWETWVMESADKGEAWSEPTELVVGDRGGRGPVRNHILVLSDGTWLAPASIEKNRVWNAFVDRSVDRGVTWEKSDTLLLNRKVVIGEGVIQPALWESKPGHVHMLLRTSAGKIGRSDSFDYGKTWSHMTLTALPNNNSGIDLVKLPSGILALVYNPVSGNWGKRYPMQLALSLDNGNTWPVMQEIESGSGEDEFSYPSITEDESDLVFCYTWNRQRIRFVKIKLEPIQISPH